MYGYTSSVFLLQRTVLFLLHAVQGPDLKLCSISPGTEEGKLHVETFTAHSVGSPSESWVVLPG